MLHGCLLTAYRPAELTEVMTAAQARGQNLSEFIRNAALHEAREATPQSRRWLDAPVAEALDELVKRVEEQIEAGSAAVVVRASPALMLQPTARETPRFVIDGVTVIPQRLVEGGAAGLQDFEPYFLRIVSKVALSDSSFVDCDGSSVSCTTSSTKFDRPTPIRRTGRLTALASRVSSVSAAS